MYQVDPSKLTLRETKGSELSWAEADQNIKALRDALNQLGLVFNEDGSLDPSFLRNTVLNYLATAFIGSTYSFISPVGKVIWLPKALDVGVANPTDGSVWVKAEGQWVLKSDYPKLWAFCDAGDGTGVFDDVVEADGCSAISTPPDTSEMFRVPDLRGRVLLGSGTGIDVGAADTGKRLYTLTHTEQGRVKLAGIFAGAAGTGGTGAKNMIGVAINGQYVGGNPPVNQSSTLTIDLDDGAEGDVQGHNNMMPFASGVHYILAGYKVSDGWV